MNNIEYEKSLINIIKSSENRFIWYKQQLEFIFKNKEIYNPTDDFVVWYRNFLRDEKNESEKSLKSYKEELTYYRQELNPPSFYPY